MIHSFIHSYHIVEFRTRIFNYRKYNTINTIYKYNKCWTNLQFLQIHNSTKETLYLNDSREKLYNSYHNEPTHLEMKTSLILTRTFTGRQNQLGRNEYSSQQCFKSISEIKLPRGSNKVAMMHFKMRKTRGNSLNEIDCSWRCGRFARSETQFRPK